MKSSSMLSVVGSGTSLDKNIWSTELLQSVYGGISKIHPCGQSTVASSAPEFCWVQAATELLVQVMTCEALTTLLRKRMALSKVLGLV